jgi:PadR family transcriptional regulator PadR
MAKQQIEFMRGTLDLVVLRTLRDGPNHGYGIARTIQETSEGLLNAETGSLYPALRRLEARGWIQGSWTVSDRGHQVREYRITSDGKRQLDKEQRRWQDVARAMSLILGMTTVRVTP